MSRQRLYALVLPLLVALAGAGGWLVVRAVDDRPAVGSDAAAGDESAATAIGGSFSLVDHTGKRVTDRDFRGRFMLVFFGYTYCPDICPTSLANIAQVMDELGKDAERVVPLFISVDPQRDTPEVLADFVHQFHPAIVGLTGTPEEIREVAQKYRVYYRKVVPDEAGDSSPGADEDYLMDHSAYVYLMGPDGRFLQVFSHTQKPEDIANAIRKAMADFSDT